MFIFYIISVSINNMRKKTHEEFIEEMTIKNPNIEILSEYINNKTKIKCKCSKGHIWEARPNDLINKGQGCPKCKKRTHKEFIEEMKAKNSNIEILGTYINSKTKIKCECLIDGYTWDVLPHNLLRGQGCPKCSGNKKKTHKEFVKEINNENIIFLTEYINATTHIKCKCKIDGYIWNANPRSLLITKECPKCRGNIRRSTEEFIAELNAINPNIIIRSEFISVNTHIKCKCKIDGTEWNTKPKHLLRRKRPSGCPTCGRKRIGESKKKDNNDFMEIVKTLNLDYELLGEYVGVFDKIKCKCKICGYEFERSPNNIYRSNECPKCMSTRVGKSQMLNYKDFINKINKIDKSVKVMSDYNGTREKVKLECLRCKHEWESRATDLYKKNRTLCPICNKNLKIAEQTKTHNEFLEEVEKLNLDITLLNKYQTKRQKIKYRCNKCGNESEVYPSSLLSGSSCAICKVKSKGEDFIYNYLKKKNIKFETQFKIKECSLKKELPFDFAIFSKKSLIALIEYNGKQHYEPINWFGGEQQFLLQQRRDKIKLDYCISNNIPLIEIPYWIKDIEAYLEEQLNKINKPLQLSF